MQLMGGSMRTGCEPTRDPVLYETMRPTRWAILEGIMSKSSVAAIAFALGLALGFVAGWESMKHQIRSAFTKAFSGTQESSSGSSGPAVAQETPAAVRGSMAAAEPTITPRAPIVGVDLLRKEFVDGRVSDQISFALKWTNLGEREIRAFTGVLVFRDLFDRPIQRVNLTYEDGLKPGEVKSWEGAIRYRQFNDGDIRLRSIELKDLGVTFEPRQILYSDGSREGIEESP
jgi:hypothetical protein